MRIHLISIGGAVMHNFALALAQHGHQVTGSDDEIFEPSKSRLKEQGLFPKSLGWNAQNITIELDLIILGMHAREDNPELKKAKKLAIPIYSFPAYTYEQSQNQERLVVAGSHGKTTTTGMMMHVFRVLNKEFDYLVGSKLDGYDRMVQFSNAPVILIEGDEYLSSALDRRPKFLHYKPQLAMITGIAWDHINVFPTYENYIAQFELFIKSMPLGSACFYNEIDVDLNLLCKKLEGNVNAELKPYGMLDYRIAENGIEIIVENEHYRMPWFGKHNVSNMTGAMLLAEQHGIKKIDFIKSMQSFGGTSRRLENIYEADGLTVIRDFAHSPSKLSATTAAVKEQYNDSKLIAVFELHTYSSLQRDFLPHYKGTMQQADRATVYIDNHVFEIKRMEPLSKQEIQQGFASPVVVINNKMDLIQSLRKEISENTILLLMSSGSFSGLIVEDLL